MNLVVMIGNMCNDPVARKTSGGKDQSSFRLAVQRQFKNSQGERTADFFSVICFGVTANFVNSYLTKGRKVAVEGSIQNRSYDDKDGVKHWVTEIVAQKVEALGGRETATGQDNEYNDFTEVDDPDLPDYF